MTAVKKPRLRDLQRAARREAKDCLASRVQPIGNAMFWAIGQSDPTFARVTAGLLREN